MHSNSIVNEISNNNLENGDKQSDIKDNNIIVSQEIKSNNVVEREYIVFKSEKEEYYIINKVSEYM